MTHFKTLILAILMTLTTPLAAEEASPVDVLEPGVENAAETPTVALTAPEQVSAEILIGDNETRTISQCETELEVKREIYNVAYWLRGTTNDQELWDSLSPAAQAMIGDDLGEITMWAAEDDFRTNHMICHQLHPDTFPAWKSELLAEAIEDQKPPTEEAVARHRLPVTLNQRQVPLAFTAEVVLRGDAGGPVEQKSLASETADGTD